LPNAFAYYLLVLGLDLLTTQELITYKQLLYLFVIRSVLGFSPLFVYTLELVLSLDAHTVMGRKVFFDKLLNFYTTILHHYHHRKIIRCDHGYISREEK
jgi:hypothetical protein